MNVMSASRIAWAKPSIRSTPLTEEVVLELMKNPRNRAIIARKFAAQMNAKRED